MLLPAEIQRRVLWPAGQQACQTWQAALAARHACCIAHASSTDDLLREAERPIVPLHTPAGRMCGRACMSRHPCKQHSHCAVQHEGDCGSLRSAACLVRLPDQSLSSTEPVRAAVEWLRLTTSGVVLPLVCPLLRRERLPKRSSLQISASCQAARLRQTWSWMAPMSSSTALHSNGRAEQSAPVVTSNQTDTSKAEQSSTALTALQTNGCSPTTVSPDSITAEPVCGLQLLCVMQQGASPFPPASSSQATQ